MVQVAVILKAVTLYLKDKDAFIAIISFYTSDNHHTLTFSLEKPILQDNQEFIERDKLFKLMEYASIKGCLEELSGKLVRIKENDEMKMIAFGHIKENKWIEL